MKYSEATKLIKGLSKKFSINDDKSVFKIIYKSKPVVWVDKQEQFNFRVVDASASGLAKMPYGHKLLMILSELEMTPISEREDELKFRVKMLPRASNWEIYLNLGKRSKDIFINDSDEIDEVQTIFTKSEYDKLQQKYHDWLPKFDDTDPHFEFLETKNEIY